MDSCIRVSPVRDNGLACLCHLGPGSFHFAFFFFLSTFLLFYFSIFIINFCVSFIMHQGSITLHFFIIKEKKKIEEHKLAFMSSMKNRAYNWIRGHNMYTFTLETGKPTLEDLVCCTAASIAKLHQY